MKLATRIVIVSALVLVSGEAFAAGGPSFGGARGGRLVVGNLGQTYNGPTQNTPIVTLPPVVHPPAMRPR
jgi:hypothetical protein